MLRKASPPSGKRGNLFSKFDRRRSIYRVREHHHIIILGRNKAMSGKIKSSAAQEKGSGETDPHVLPFSLQGFLNRTTLSRKAVCEPNRLCWSTVILSPSGDSQREGRKDKLMRDRQSLSHVEWESKCNLAYKNPTRLLRKPDVKLL
jgi:hypothetical protein